MNVFLQDNWILFLVLIVAGLGAIYYDRRDR